MQIADLLNTLLKTHAPKTAIISKEQNITFQQLSQDCFKLANGLSALGVKKGDKVAIYLLNDPEYIYSYLAVWLLGAVAVPLDYMLTEEELISCIDRKS
ncbi:MAG: class I adenylate-forming enzyme family protein, partial [Candidatus Omnitrophica bacterium]|nr:class I adenylate-forming enzyme family protein [Candidatus Omnitrophota bacterium]